MTEQARPVAGDKLTGSFLRSQFCRVIQVDGVFGGLTPQGTLAVALYSQYATLPSQITYEATQQGTPKEVSRVGEPTLTWEVEVEAMLSIETARSLRDWLNRQLEQATVFQEQLKRFTGTKPQ